MESNIDHNPKAFWSFIKNKRDARSSVPGRVNLDETVVETGPDIASLFERQFFSVYSPDAGTRVGVWAGVGNCGNHIISKLIVVLVIVSAQVGSEVVVASGVRALLATYMSCVDVNSIVYLNLERVRFGGRGGERRAGAFDDVYVLC
ncbi:hypothetical protein ACJJTC_015316 [Scirpophaga incertulas]